MISSIAKTLLVLVFFWTFQACSQKPVVQEFPVTASPSEEVKRFEADMKTAFGNQSDVLSPTHYNEAQNILDDARESLENQKDAADAQETLHLVAEGRAHLDAAIKMTATSKSLIAEVVQARQEALNAGAYGYFEKDFKDIDEDLAEVTGNIEKNDLDQANEYRAKLQSAYLDLELRALKEKNLANAKQNIETAKDEKAGKFAPRTLAIAEKSYQDTEAYITGNRHSTDEIKRKSDETLAQSERLLKITRSAKGLDSASPEETALIMEKDQAQIAAKQSELNSVQGTNRSLLSAKQALEAEQAFNESFERAQAQFSKNEAEVYKQDGALMIRLRGLEFPTAKADLKKSNFALLSKVQKVIKDFGDSSVVVEGHTDSVGGKSANDKLSSARAEAVKEYLITNEAVPSAKVEAIGYGYQKPLASNKTANGRAQNRRVDIVIKPQKKQSL